MQNIKSFLSSINDNDLNDFLKKTKTNLNVHKDIEEVVSDTSWIDMIEESIPYLDNIIRNPRRFIVQEENIVPIAKAKVVTEESIKHLAQHTSLIQEVKEDGSIIPEKLLNVYREETTDLYENRFIKSLVDNLYQFVENKLSSSDQKSYSKVASKITYQGEELKQNKTFKVNLALESNWQDEHNMTKDGHSLEDRISHIRDVLADFHNSTFIKSLKEASPVRSPIRKTNVILKEPNFIKALELWEYLEKNNIKPVTSVKKYTVNECEGDVKAKFDLALFIELMALNETSEKPVSVDNLYIEKIIHDYVFKNDVGIAQFKRTLTKEFNEALKDKNKIKRNIDSKFKLFWDNYTKNKKKAFSLLK